MAIFTPRGLKIRIDIPTAFALMARLYPTVSPFRVLKTTEGLECIPGMLTLGTAVIGFITGISPLAIGITVGLARVVGNLVTGYGFFAIPGLVGLATTYSYIAGWGVLYPATLVVGFIFADWLEIIAFLSVEIIVGSILWVLEFRRAKRYHALIGNALSLSEVNFFNAYRIHATRVGITTNIDLEPEELEEHNWSPVFEDFAMRWPEVAHRFS